MEKVFILEAKRSAIGSFLGSLSQVNLVDFSAQVLEQMFSLSIVNKNDVDEVVIGNVIASNQGQGLARQISIKAGLSIDIPAYTVNMVCGSGMKSVMNAYQSIKTGDNHLVVAGGVESLSQAPFYVSADSRKGLKAGEQKLFDSIYKDGLIDPFNQVQMGYTAELIAEKLNITRQAQDDYAFNTQQKAIKADDLGYFKSEIVPIHIKTKDGVILFDKDEYINRKTNLEKMHTLKTIFKENGTVTAATSSGLNDGASFILLASESYIKKHHLNPIAELVAVSQVANDPLMMGLAPNLAIKNLLTKTNLTLEAIDLLEINEAFASQVIGVVKELSISTNINEQKIFDKLNIHGGAISLGHPLGASGNRVIVSLVNQLHQYNKKLGIASLCIGGGMATAVLIKKV